MSTPTPPPAQPTPPLSAASQKVADLEQQLTEAAQRMTQVQAELSQARADDPNHPQVPVAYDGHAPVVMINGQQVPNGQAIDLKAMLGGMFGQAGTTTTANGQVINMPPVISVNGQVVSGGQPVDLAAVVGAENLEHIRNSLNQLGLGASLGGLFGAMPTTTAAAGVSPPASGVVPGPSAALPYAATPGEVKGSGGKVMAYLAAFLVVGLIGVLIYLGVTN